MVKDIKKKKSELGSHIITLDTEIPESSIPLIGMSSKRDSLGRPVLLCWAGCRGGDYINIQGLLVLFSSTTKSQLFQFRALFFVRFITAKSP